MHKIIGVVLLVVGVFLLVRGYDISRSITSQISNIVPGTTSQKVMIFYIGGAVCCAVGLMEVFRSGKK
jgi:uncharacterized membrane protein